MNTGKIITFNKVVGLKELFENKETFTDWKFLVEKKKNQGSHNNTKT